MSSLLSVFRKGDWTLRGGIIVILLETIFLLLVLSVAREVLFVVIILHLIVIVVVTSCQIVEHVHKRIDHLVVLLVEQIWRRVGFVEMVFIRHEWAYLVDWVLSRATLLERVHHGDLRLLLLLAHLTGKGFQIGDVLQDIPVVVVDDDVVDSSLWLYFGLRHSWIVFQDIWIYYSGAYSTIVVRALRRGVIGVRLNQIQEILPQIDAPPAIVSSHKYCIIKILIIVLQLVDA